MCVFWNGDIDCNIHDEDEQQITCEIKHNELQYKLITIFIYVKCKYNLKRPVRDKMLQQDTIDNKSWCSVGDFNVITLIDEELGGCLII